MADYIWNRAAYIQRPSSIISFVPNLHEADDDNFAKIAGGKILININNHKDSIKVKARIETSVLFYLVEQAANPKNGFHYEEIKIFPSIEEYGQYKGMSPMSKLSISRNETFKDGRQNPSPWGIHIENGYAFRQETKTGGYMAKAGTYKKAADAFFSMNDMEFYSALYECREYVSLFKKYLCENGYLEDKFRKMENNNQRYKESHAKAQTQPRTSNRYSFEAKILDLRANSFLAEMKDNGGKPFSVYFSGNPGLKRGQTRSITVEVKDGKAYLIA